MRTNAPTACRTVLKAAVLAVAALGSLAAAEPPRHDLSEAYYLAKCAASGWQDRQAYSAGRPTTSTASSAAKSRLRA